MVEFFHKTTLVGVTALMLCAASGKEAHAQRTMRGESMISAQAHYPFSSPNWKGADLSYGRYLLGSFWRAGAFLTEYSHQLDDDMPMGYQHIAAYGDWMYRLAGCRNRALNLYGGAGVFLGYEAVDAFKAVPEEYKTNFSEGYFLYGVSLSAELEIFFCRKVAFVITGRLPLNFSSQFGWFHSQVGAGIRINI